MEQVLEEIQHFGITVRNHAKSRRFYARLLGFPLLGQTVNRGERSDLISGLDDTVNKIVWYQLGDGGMETFFLPHHPSADIDHVDPGTPGYKYTAYYVDGFDKYIHRLEKARINPRVFDTRAGSCAIVLDPDGNRILFFDTGQQSAVGSVSCVKEAGLAVCDVAAYEEFFDAIGLWKIEDNTDFIESVLGKSLNASLYGNIRIIELEDTKREEFPTPKFCDVGIKHVAFYVADVDSFYYRCMDIGIKFLFTPQDVPGGSRIAYFSDPEGNTIEAMQVDPLARTAALAAGTLARGALNLASRLTRF